MRRVVLSRLAAASVLAAGIVVGGSMLASAGASPKGICVIKINDDSYSTPQDTDLTVADPGVVANDVICGTDGLVISLSSPSHGDLQNFDDGDGGFVYVPDAGFVGTDSFTYTLEDVETSLVGTVTITVSEQGTTTTQASTTTTMATTTTTAATTSSSVEASSTSQGTPLPVTGSHTGMLAVIGFSLVGAGLLLLAGSRKRSVG